MTNKKNKNNNMKKNNKLGQTSNPVSYMPTLARSIPLTKNQRSFEGKDLIITDVPGILTFQAIDLFLNPRLESFFPGASLISQRYDMYQFDMLEFHWHPTQAVTTTPGVVFMAWEPNANQHDTSTTIARINAMEHHTECPVYRPDCVLRIPKNCLGAPRYMRAGPVSGDLNLYDTGRLILALGSCSTTDPLGYVQVHYRLRFMNYHLEEPRSFQNRVSEIAVGTRTALPASGPTTFPFDTVLQDFGGWAADIDLTGGAFRLPLGVYLIQVHLRVYDDTNEDIASFAQVYKNGAPLAVAAASDVTLSATGLGTDFQYEQYISCVVRSEGTTGDLFRVDLDWNASGNLSADEGSRVIITALS